MIAIDVRENNLEHGSDERVVEMLNLAKMNNVPYVFSGTRNELGMSLYGKILQRKAKSSAISVINYEGYKPKFKKILKSVQELRQDFNSKFSDFIQNSPKSHQTEEVVEEDN